jgi:carboxymethylenebutenolidase
MERKKASDFPQAVLDIFDGYVHGAISRREFLDRAAKYAVGGFTAAAMLESLRPNYAWAQQVPKEDSRIRTQYQTYPSPQGTGTMRGYLALPAQASGELPGVVVIHENRGLNPYTEDVARRLAVDGFIAFAPDALTPVGGYPGNEEQAAKLYSSLDAGKRTEDILAAATYLKSRPDVGKFGAVGFCAGGSMVNTMAVRMPDLAAGVPFYGAPPSAADVAKIKAPLLIHHAGLDERLIATLPAFEAALKANGLRYQAYVYPGTNHGFHNDTTPRYDEAAAKLAWSRTLAFFREHLKA